MGELAAATADACCAADMLRVRGRVQHGRLVVDEPSELPEGSEIDLVAADAPVDEQAWPPEVDAELVRRNQEVEDGNLVPAEKFLAKLRGRRTA